jgi:hypothetical protein
MRLLRFRLRTLMISIAFLALILTVIMQAILLRRAAVREAQLRAEAEFQRARVEMAEYVRRAAEAQAQWHRQDSLAAPGP